VLSDRRHFATRCVPAAAFRHLRRIYQLVQSVWIDGAMVILGTILWNRLYFKKRTHLFACDSLFHRVCKRKPGFLGGRAPAAFEHRMVRIDKNVLFLHH
jgi:hypothetical protein